MIRGLTTPYTLLCSSLRNQVTRTLSTGPAVLTGAATGDVEQSRPAPQEGIKIHKQLYKPPDPIRRKAPRLKTPSTDEIFSILEDLQHDLTPPTPSPQREGALDASSSESRVLHNIGDMPLSPLMHPKLIGARRRHLKAKQYPSKDLTDFETLLAKNSYGICQFSSPSHLCLIKQDGPDCCSY